MKDLVALFVDDKFEDPHYTNRIVKLISRKDLEKMCNVKVEKTEKSLKILAGSVVAIPQGMWCDESHTPYPSYYLHHVKEDYEQSLKEIENKIIKSEKAKRKLEKCLNQTIQ